KRVSAGTSARMERARRLSVYGTSGGAASSARSAVTISLTALPIPLRAPSKGVTSIATAGRAEAGIGRWYHICGDGRVRHMAGMGSVWFAGSSAHLGGLYVGARDLAGCDTAGGVADGRGC